MRHLLCLLALPAALCMGQVTSGSLSGYVQDPTGNAVARCQVALVSDSQAVRRSTVTDLNGLYQFIDLAPGAWTVRVSAPGFQEALVPGVPVTVDGHARVNVKLVLASEKAQVQVMATTPPVDSDSAALSTILTRPEVASLPLNRRDFLQLALLTPGVAPPVEDSELSTRGSVALHANGAREEFNNYLLDGIDNNDGLVNRYVMQPSVDLVQEFRIATNSYSAEYGRNAGAQVNVVTRSGSNDLHGFGYDYMRNRALDARNFFDGKDRQKYIRNQFGAGVGGAVAKNRSFFFLSFDGLRERRGLSRLATVPSAAERDGDLSGRKEVAIDPFTRQPFPNNRIPASRISPVGRSILNLFPLPDRPGQSANYLAQPVAREAATQGSGRLDQALGSGGQLMVRYGYSVRDIFEPYAEESNDVPGFGDLPFDTGHNATIQYQKVFGPRVVNSARAGFNRAVRRVLAENNSVDVNSLWGVNWLPKRAVDKGYPGITIAGLSRVGDANQLPIDRAATTLQFTDDLTIIRGAHTMKFGGEYRNSALIGILDLFARGSLTFSGAIAGSGIADTLLGFPTLAIKSEFDNPQALRNGAWGVYAQDEWRITPRLTLLPGVRYEFTAPAVDPNNRMSILDLGAKRLAQVGTNGIPRAGIRSDKNNVAPRLGFAWSPDTRTAVRGGYGLFYDSGIGNVSSALYFNPPYFNVRVYFPTETSLLTLGNPFASGITPPASLSTIDPTFTSAYLQHWNLNVQRELGSLGVLSVAYAGSKGTHLVRSRDLNQPPPGPGVVQARRPLPQFGNVLIVDSGGNSVYHALQTSFSRRAGLHVSVLATWTWSKSIDDTSAFLGTKSDKNFPQNSRDFGAERAVSSYDLTHRATVAAVWRIPGRTVWARNFEAALIAAAQSGQPFTPMLRFDNSNTGNSGGNFGQDRPDVIGDPHLDSPTPAQWFRTSAFRIPRPGTFGTAGRNSLRGPGYFNTDVSLSRRFAVSERVGLTFQAQAFNVLNRANFDLPERYADEPATFGRVLSAKAPRQIQFALRFAF